MMCARSEAPAAVEEKERGVVKCVLINKKDLKALEKCVNLIPFTLIPSLPAKPLGSQPFSLCLLLPFLVFFASEPHLCILLLFMRLLLFQLPFPPRHYLFSFFYIFQHPHKPFNPPCYTSTSSLSTTVNLLFSPSLFLTPCLLSLNLFYSLSISTFPYFPFPCLLLYLSQPHTSTFHPPSSTIPPPYLNLPYLPTLTIPPLYLNLSSSLP